MLTLFHPDEDLRQIRQYLTRDAALMAANAVVGSRLDYCTSLFRGLSVSNLRKLQCIQKSLVRIVCRATYLSHTTPLRKALHWLPIRHRCIFKTALLVYKYLHTNSPKYFSPFLKVRQSTKQFGLSFAYDAPKIWNELPDDVRSATSIASFRKNLRHTYSAKLILLSIFHLIWHSP